MYCCTPETAFRGNYTYAQIAMRPPINKLLHCPSHLLNLIIQKVRPVFSSPCANEADISCRTLLNALNLVRIYRRLDRCTLFPVDIKLGMSAIGESGKACWAHFPEWPRPPARNHMLGSPVPPFVGRALIYGWPCCTAHQNSKASRRRSLRHSQPVPA